MSQGGVLLFTAKVPGEASGFSLYHLRKSDEGADTDLMYDFCLPHGSRDPLLSKFPSVSSC